MAISTAKGGTTSFMRRQGEIGGATALIGVSIFLGIACATWTVTDPSFSQSNQNGIDNWGGATGAAVADILMQVFGLGAALVVAFPAVWGLMLIAGRRVDQIWRRAWQALGGAVLGAGAIGCFAAPAGWPLPIGLGGVAGDLVLKIPALVTGVYPAGAFGMAVAAVLAVPALWLCANGAGFVGHAKPRLEDGARLPAATQDEEDEGEGRFALAFGALAHLAYSARSALARKAATRAPRRDQPEFGDTFRDWQEEPVLAPTPRSARTIRVTAPAAFADTYVDPMDEDAFDAVPPRAATVTERREPAMRQEAPAPAAPVLREEPALRAEPALRSGTPYFGAGALDGEPAARRPAERAAPVGRLQDTVMPQGVRSRATPTLAPPRPSQMPVPAAFHERREPSFEAEPFAAPGEALPAGGPEPWDVADAPEAFDPQTGEILDAPYDAPFEDELGYEAPEDDGRLTGAPDRAGPAIVPRADAPAPMDEDEDEAPAGGWRGLAANIVAFPGRRPGRAEDAPRAPMPAAAPAARASAPALHGGEAARAVSSGTVSAEQQRLRTGSGRAVALKPSTHAFDPGRFELPSVEFLTPPKPRGKDSTLSPEVLQENARLLEGVLEDFGVKGEIIEVRPGPVVTLYELEPAPGIKSSRVIGLADDIARSMSAIAARVAVIPGKNAIGIELPNQRRETVYFREMIGSEVFQQNKGKLALALGKTIGGEPVIADLAKMPHLLVAGTTGSGKSVSINTMILSLLYRMTPAECRLIMIDPKMLELSIYDGIPHLLSPVVTDPKKAVVALKWTVREMEDRYRKMSKVGVRNIDGFNTRVAAALERGETISRTVQTGFDRETGEPIFETEEFDLQPLPYIVVIIDEMADLMMVAGKDIEGAVQRLAQMARAAGIHVIMATQRPSVDVITGTIKANFPTRISFQVTSKIDSRTILGEQGAEQLLGMGDMLFMAGGGRTQRVHGPFVDDGEVEEIVKHLKAQGAPDYLDAILVDEEEEAEAAASGGGAGSGAVGGEESADLYDQAVAVVLRDGKASTSYVQRRLGIGYNRAASIIERMEKEGIVGPANHAGKREILVPTEGDRM
ncbi:DNA translocase FtsK [Aurantimonas sp. Leaf443]|uniref:DNA translocase FtsK n=2 Tax=Hyphomicrobiales TaxID=356 RepID=UPI0006F959EE|nr:DNA translocase FtsK [Aurantimonas sp. Leaf443]KQT87449.1 cell division protein [Aurantimonas sp. Leaf443]